MIGSVSDQSDKLHKYSISSLFLVQTEVLQICEKYYIAAKWDIHLHLMLTLKLNYFRCMKIRSIVSKISEYTNTEELPEQDLELVFCAREAGLNAYAPYSGFRVGAAVLLENGEIISSNNQENAAFPSGLCAERIALFYAASNFPSVAVKAIAVSYLNGDKSSEIAKPCGSCRQVLAEYEDLSGIPIRIILDGGKIICISEGIDNLLPLRFKKSDLK